MTLLNDLQNIQKKSYKVWFERFIRRTDLHDKIMISAEQGNEEVRIMINGNEWSPNDKQRMASDLFIDYLKTEFPGLNISLQQKDVLFGTKNYVVINWGINDHESAKSLPHS